jgi:multidrug/hemolysin transport system permease protein
MIALYFLFIGRVYSSGMENLFPDTFSSKQANFIIYLQMMAGVLIISSLSLSLGVFATVAKDFEKRKTDGLLLTAATKAELTWGYFLAGFIASFILSFFMWAVSFLLIWAVTGYAVSFGIFLMAAVILAVAALVSAGIMILLTVIIKSSVAVSVISGVVGTFLGFVCGIYMPYSNLGEGTKNFGSLFPFTHLTIWLKQTLLNNAYKILNIPAETADILTDGFFSAENVGLLGANVPLTVMLILSGIFAAVCFICAWIFPQKRK